MDLKVAIVQANPRVGDLRANLEIARKAVLDNRDMDLVVLPESFLCGYPADDLVLDAGFMQALSHTVVELGDFVRATGGPAVLVGAPEPGADLPFNAAHFLGPDGSRRVVRKADLPNNGPFDEKRTFAVGEKRGPISFRGFNIGVVICEEMWSPDVCGHLAGRLSDVLIILNGSPYTRGKHLGDRTGHARRRVRETGLPLIYANLVGGQDELVFDGGSFVMQTDGTIWHNAPFFEETTLRLTLTRSSHAHGGPAAINIEKDAPGYKLTHGFWEPEGLDYAACVSGLRDYVRKGGFEKVVIGISGGADSALAGAMAVDALGAQNVTGLTLPSAITGDKGDAYLVAEALGIRLVEIPIGPSVLAFTESFDEAMMASVGDVSSGVAVENVQARMRMIALMTWSNQTGAMLVTTGNKSECSVGYCTLYGDMAGGFNPLKDLYKTEVWDMMRLRAAGRPFEWMLGPRHGIVPLSIVDKVPTAGLAIGQTDEDRLGPYPVLDALLRRIVDDQVGSLEALARVRREDAPSWTAKWGRRYPDVAGWGERWLTEEHALDVARMVQRSEYKRRQSAPGTKVGGRAYGRDRRYPIVNGFEGRV